MVKLTIGFNTSSSRRIAEKHFQKDAFSERRRLFQEASSRRCGQNFKILSARKSALPLRETKRKTLRFHDRC